MASQSARIPEESKKDSARTAAEISGGIPIWKMWTEGQFTSVSVNVVARHSLLMEIGIVNSVIGRILRNKVYIGTEYYPQIVDEDTFVKAQEIRGNNAKSQNRIGAYRPHPKAEIGTFAIGKVAVQYDDPYKQAEYAYSQITEVANE